MTMLSPCWIHEVVLRFIEIGDRFSKLMPFAKPVSFVFKPLIDTFQHFPAFAGDLKKVCGHIYNDIIYYFFTYTSSIFFALWTWSWTSIWMLQTEMERSTASGCPLDRWPLGESSLPKVPMSTAMHKEVVNRGCSNGSMAMIICPSTRNTLETHRTHSWTQCLDPAAGSVDDSEEKTRVITKCN